MHGDGAAHLGACDTFIGPAKKPTFLGSVNGMIVGLVAITPAAGFVNGNGAAVLGVIDSLIVFLAWTYLPKVRPFSKVDDALGVVYTHGIAGLAGGLLVGFLADPHMIEYVVARRTHGSSGVPCPARPVSSTATPTGC